MRRSPHFSTISTSSQFFKILSDQIDAILSRTLVTSMTYNMIWIQIVGFALGLSEMKTQAKYTQKEEISSLYLAPCEEISSWGDLRISLTVIRWYIMLSLVFHSRGYQTQLSYIIDDDVWGICDHLMHVSILADKTSWSQTKIDSHTDSLTQAYIISFSFLLSIPVK